MYLSVSNGRASIDFGQNKTSNKSINKGHARPSDKHKANNFSTLHKFPKNKVATTCKIPIIETENKPKR